MEKETYFGYILKEGIDITDAISKIKEYVTKHYKQESEMSIAQIVTFITDRKIAGWNEDKIKETLKEALKESLSFSISYAPNEKLSNIYTKLNIFQQEKIDSFLINLYQLNSGKILLTTELDDSLICSAFANSFDLDDLEFIECYTTEQMVIDEVISKKELVIRTNDWEEAYSLNEDKIKSIKLLDDENLMDINFKNVEYIIEHNFETRLEYVSSLKLSDILEIDKKSMKEHLELIMSDEYKKDLKEQIEKERLNLIKNITLSKESTINDLLIQC